MRVPLPRSTPAVLLLAAALFASASGGAVAGTVVTGKQIKDGSLTGQDVRNRSLKLRDLSPAAVRSLRGARGPAGAVRAYGWYDGTTVRRQSGGVTATTPRPGLVCLRVPGLSSARTVALVTLDNSGDSTASGSQSYAEVASDPTGCPAPTDFAVESFSRVAGESGLARLTQPFFFLVP